jgi:hypothetical protein
MKLFTLRIARLTAFTLGVLVAAVLFSQHSCSNRQSSQQTRRYPHVHVSRAEYEADAELDAHSYTLSEGDNLERVATLRYDHRYYDRIIKLSNHIEDENKVKAGTQLRLPNLIDILTESGFTKVAPSESELILCSRAKYGRVKDPLWALRQKANRDRVIVPKDIRLALLEAASDLEEAIGALRANKTGVTQAPRSMIGQMEQNAGSLRELADGANDGYGYALDMVEQRYALALSYGVIWAREGFK